MNIPLVRNTASVLGLLLALGSSNTALADRRHGYESQVHITIVAPAATRWAPRWNEHYDRRHDKHRHKPVFKSSPGLDRRGHIPPGSLLRDRQGACHEQVRDRYGRIIQRRVAGYYCRF